MKLMDKAFVAFAVIVLKLAVRLAGLIIDRRAAVVSTLVYVTVAVEYLLQSPGIATLTIGLYVLALGLLWKPARLLVTSVMHAHSRVAFLRANSPT
jgi:hypothetical protein